MITMHGMIRHHERSVTPTKQKPGASANWSGFPVWWACQARFSSIRVSPHRGQSMSVAAGRPNERDVST
jgi:hypothetical protein